MDGRRHIVNGGVPLPTTVSVGTIVDGITHTHTFTSAIRCCGTISHPSSCGTTDGAHNLETWTGDSDGYVSVRHGTDGRPTQKLQPEKVNGRVVVFAVEYVAPHVWVGQSNGCMAVYDVATRTCQKIIKGHSGAIFCVIAVNGIVYSGGADWKVCRYNADTLEKDVYTQMKGHTSAVRCLASRAGEYIYSGADNGTISCWRAVDAREVKRSRKRGSVGWPLAAHSDSVRSLVVHGRCLFSASSDGAIKVWDAESSEAIATLEVHTCPVTSLYVDPAAACLWSGSTDGMLSMWNVATMKKIGTLSTHQKTSIRAIREVTRDNVLKLWALTGTGEIRTMYVCSEPDGVGGVATFETVVIAEADQQQRIRGYRQRVLQNFSDLELCKAELEDLEARGVHREEQLSRLEDDEQHEGVAVALTTTTTTTSPTGSQDSRSTDTPVAAESWAHYSDALATVQCLRTTSTLAHKYFERWHRMTLNRMHAALSERQNILLTKMWRSALLHRYFHNLKTFACARRVGQQTSRQPDPSVQRVHRGDAVLREYYFSCWLEHHRQQEREQEVERMANIAGSASRLDASQQHWMRLQDYVREQRESLAVHNAASALGTLQLRGCAVRAFSHWAAFVSRKRELRCRRALAVRMSNARLTVVRQRYFTRWVDTVNTRHQARCTTTTEGERGRTASPSEGHSLPALDTPFEERALDEALREKQERLAVLNEQLKLMNDELAEQQQRLEEVRREMHVDPHASPEAQFRQAIRFLKAKSLRAPYDAREILAVRGEIIKASGAGVAPDAAAAEDVVRDALEKVKKELRLVMKPRSLETDKQRRWKVDLRSEELQVTPACLTRSCHAVTRLIVGCDALTDATIQSRWTGTAAPCGEIVANVSTLADIIDMASAHRKATKPSTAPALVMQQRSDEAVDMEREDHSSSLQPSSMMDVRVSNSQPPSPNTASRAKPVIDSGAASPTKNRT